MKLPSMNIPPCRFRALLLVCSLLLACGLLPRAASQETPAATNQAAKTALPTSEAAETKEATALPVEQATTTALPAATATSGPYSLAIRDKYPFFESKVIIGISLAAQDGTLWIGTVSGTLQKVNAYTGEFGGSLSLVPGNGGSAMTVYPVMKLAFEGQYLWAYAGFFENGPTPPHLYALDPKTGQIVKQWDLTSAEWMQGYERNQPSEDFGVSPGKIWIDSHVVDTQTFEVTQVPMPGITSFAYGGNDWMWINGENGGACDDLILYKVDDPSEEWCPDEWPFMVHTADGRSPTNPGSPMLLAGDRMWIAGSWSAESLSDTPEYTLDAYPADMDQAMQATKPLASVPLLDSDSSVLMLYAGETLWLVYTGDTAGWLYQLDAKTGETINSLDLVGEEGRSISDVPQALAADGEDLWVLTARQLLRIKLP